MQFTTVSIWHLCRQPGSSQGNAISEGIWATGAMIKLQNARCTAAHYSWGVRKYTCKLEGWPQCHRLDDTYCLTLAGAKYIKVIIDVVKACKCNHRFLRICSLNYVYDHCYVLGSSHKSDTSLCTSASITSISSLALLSLAPAIGPVSSWHHSMHLSEAKQNLVCYASYYISTSKSLASTCHGCHLMLLKRACR